MSLENLYEYVSGESQNVARLLQYPAGTEMVFIRDKNRVKMLGYNIEIWDSFKDGIQLIEDTDYTLGHVDADISSIEGFTVWGGYQILNAAYQGVELFVTAKIIGGYTARPYRPTYNSIDSDTIFTPDSVDDSLLVNSESGPVSITLADGTYINQRATIICNGSNDVSIQGSGLTDVSYSNIAVSFVWVIGGWLQLGGAGSGGGVSQGNVGIGEAVWDPAGGAIPYDKLLADGSIYNAADYPGLSARYGSSYGGDGITTFGVPNMQGITPGAFGTQDVNGNTKGDATAIGGVREDQIQDFTLQFNQVADNTNAANADFVSGGSSGGQGAKIFDSTVTSRAGDYTRSTELVGRWLIQAFDTVQEIPADPGLIKDYTLVWEETPASTVVNAWGEGLFFLAYNYDYAGSTVYGNAFMGVAIDGFDREIVIDVEQAGGDSEVRGRYDFSTNSFTIETGGSGYTNPQIHGVYKWGDVATGELNPPVDGWEELYNDYTATLSTYPNITGDGYYKIVARDVTNSESCPFVIQVNKADSTTASIVTPAVAGATLRITYSYSTDTFSIANDVGTYYFAEVWKFNSLVNVVHSYNGPLQEIDTTAGDVDVSADLANLATGAIRIYANIGTVGNHITGLPNSITLGDGKTFTIHRGEAGWRYEDVIIDEYTAVGSNGENQNIKKWSGGDMEIDVGRFHHTAALTTYIFAEPFNSTPRASGLWFEWTAVSTNMYSIVSDSITTTQVAINGTANADSYIGWGIKGRWKAGA